MNIPASLDRMTEPYTFESSCRGHDVTVAKGVLGSPNAYSGDGRKTWMPGHHPMTRVFNGPTEEDSWQGDVSLLPKPSACFTRPLYVMPGLDPGIHVLFFLRKKVPLKGSHIPLWFVLMQNSWVYIMTDKPHGTLYVGVTTNLARRVHEHREGVIDGFTKRYGLTRLVYYEAHADIGAAIQREKNLKHWSRTWKVKLIHQVNPSWDDLYDSLA